MRKTQLAINKYWIPTSINRKAKTKINYENKLRKMVLHADSFPESLENMKNGTEKKTNENHTKRQKSLCYDFKKGNCRRRFCRVSFEFRILSKKQLGNFISIFFFNRNSFSLQYPHAMSFDQVVFCHDFQNNGCFRNNCKWVLIQSCFFSSPNVSIKTMD